MISRRWKSRSDLLGLGMLSCLRRGFDLLNTHYGLTYKRTSDIPSRKACLRHALACRFRRRVPGRKPRADVDAAAVEAEGILRSRHRSCDRAAGSYPGQHGASLFAPAGKSYSVTYPSPAPEHGPSDELEKVLHKTLGVPLFQEQAMRVAIEAAKFSPIKATRLRRAMATFRRVGTIDKFRDDFVAAMSARGYDPEFAASCFRQIEGFGEYGFPESHAASFALLVYASAWIKCHYPDVFVATLLNSQPMGFYAPAQLVRDAQEHGVETRAVDVNFSNWDSTLDTARCSLPFIHVMSRWQKIFAQRTRCASGFARSRAFLKTTPRSWKRHAAAENFLRCAISGCAPGFRFPQPAPSRARRCVRLARARPA